MLVKANKAKNVFIFERFLHEENIKMLPLC